VRQSFALRCQPQMVHRRMRRVSSGQAHQLGKLPAAHWMRFSPCPHADVLCSLRNARYTSLLHRTCGARSKCRSDAQHYCIRVFGIGNFSDSSRHAGESAAGASAGLHLDRLLHRRQHRLGRSVSALRRLSTWWRRPSFESGFAGGGQIGRDYQFASNWVIGVQGLKNGVAARCSAPRPY
jgi:hypothetical protein